MDDLKRAAEQDIVVAELRSEVQEHRALAEMGRAVATAQEPAEAYASVASQLVHLLSVDSLHLVLIDEAEGMATVEYVFGRAIEGWESGRRFGIAGTAFEPVVRDRTHFHAAAESSRHLTEQHPVLTFAAASGIASMLVLPLVFRGHAVAAMAVGSAKPYAYQRRDQELAERAGGLLAGAVAHAQRMVTLRKASETEAALSQLASSLGSTLDMNELFLRLVDGLAKLVKYDRLVVNDIDAEKGELVRVFVAGAGITGATLGGRQPIAGSTVVEVMRTRSTVLVSGLPDDEIKRRFPSAAPAVDIGLRAFMTAPLIVDGNVVATLHLFSEQSQGYAERDAALLRRAAGLLSSVIAAAKAHATALQVAANSANQAAAIAEDPMAEIGRVVWSAPDLETMYEEVGQQLRKMVPFDRFSVWAVDMERGALVNIYAAGVEGRQLKRGESLSLMRSQAEIGLGGGGRNGQRNGGEQTAERLSYLAKGIAGGLSGLILVPLLYGNEGVGMLTLGTRIQGSFTPEHETIAERVGQLVAARVGLEQLNERRGQTAQRLQEQVERLGTEVVERTRELDAVRAELDSLRAAVHKDLRSSLTTIEGASQAVLDPLSEGKGSEGRVQLLRVRAASKTIAQQLDALMQMSDVSSRPLQRRQTDLTILAKASARKLRQTEQDRHITLSVEQGLTADSDPDLLEVMLDHLMAQAWKRAMKAQKPKVQLRAAEQGGKLVFSLKDNGEGMSPKAAKTMFEAGQAVSVATPDDELAAALVKRVVDRHGGRVWAESEPGKGTTVYFSL
ncbi:MAG: GAF domain-containing protein [SAR202 cluster bacterium]|nr:GAF domain-containing protein [SAR202 cluster bacterium]